MGKKKWVERQEIWRRNLLLSFLKIKREKGGGPDEAKCLYWYNHRIIHFGLYASHHGGYCGYAGYKNSRGHRAADIYNWRCSVFGSHHNCFDDDDYRQAA